MKRQRLTKLTVRRLNQRTKNLPHETSGNHIVLICADKKTFLVKETQLFYNNTEAFETYVPGNYTHYIVLPNWLG